LRPSVSVTDAEVAFTTICPGAGEFAVSTGFAAMVVGVSTGALVEVADPLELAAWIAMVVGATAVVVGAIVPAVVDVVLSGACVITIPSAALAFPVPSGGKTIAGATVVEVVVVDVVVGVVVVATGTTWFEFVEGAAVVLEVDEVELELPDPGIVVDVEDEVELDDEDELELEEDEDEDELELEEDEEDEQALRGDSPLLHATADQTEHKPSLRKHRHASAGSSFVGPRPSELLSFHKHFERRGNLCPGQVALQIVDFPIPFDKCIVHNRRRSFECAVVNLCGVFFGLLVDCFSGNRQTAFVVA
jgi:hypothetical protein